MICPDCFLILKRVFNSFLYITTVLERTWIGHFGSRIRWRYILQTLSTTRIARWLYDNFDSVDAFTRDFYMDRSIVEFIQHTGSKRFVNVDVPIRIATVCSAATCTNDISIRVFNDKIGGSVYSPFRQTTIGQDQRDVIGGRESAITIHSANGLLGVRRFRKEVKGYFARRYFHVQARDYKGFFFTNVQVSRDGLGARFFRYRSRRIRDAAVSDKEAGRVIAYLTGVRSDMRINDLATKDRRNNRAAFRNNGLDNRDIVHQILRTNVRVATIFRVRGAYRLLTNVMFRDYALVSKRCT